MLSLHIKCTHLCTPNKVDSEELISISLQVSKITGKIDRHEIGLYPKWTEE